MAKLDDIPIMQVVNLCNIQIKRYSGSSAYVDCPFCNDTKGHMNVNIVKELWRCNRCNESGNKLTLYAKYFGIDNKEAFVKLTDGIVPDKITKRKHRDIIIKEPCVAAIETRHLVYTELLNMLKLAFIHRTALKKRGLDDDAINRAGYKSVPIIGSENIVSKLVSKGLNVQNVPGFYYDNGKWDLYLPSSGILIPVRNRLGMIQGMQIRFDNPKNQKYMWLTSNDLEKGVPSSSYIHIVGNLCKTMYLTEGPLKADVAHYFSGLSFIAIAGVTAVSALPALLKDLKKLGVRTIVESLDMDKNTNENVRTSCEKIHNMIYDCGLISKKLVWDEKFKGIDDYYFNVIRGEEKYENKSIKNKTN